MKDCITFRAKTYQERLDVLFQKHICRNCLVPGHYAKGCAAVRACERSGCVRKHHTLLHPPDEARGHNDVDSRAVSHQASATASGRKRVCLRVIPVQGLCNGRIIETYALLDDGSDVSLCDQRLLEKLGLKGISRQFTLTTLSNTEEQSGLEVSLNVSSIDVEKGLCIARVWSVEGIPVSQKSIPVPDDLRRWPHLQDLSFPQIDEQKAMLLIGGHCPEAFWVLDERKGASDEPYAVKFPLGWTLLGPVGPANPLEEFHVNLVRSLDNDDLLQSQVKRFWSTDFGESLASSEVCMSLEDKRALKIMNETVRKIDGHYQVGCLGESNHLRSLTIVFSPNQGYDR